MMAGNASQAYELAGYTANPGAKRASACRLLTNRNVKRRLDELRKAVGRKSEASAMSLALELDESRRLALELGQCAAAIAATMGKAKLLGLDVKRVEIGGAGAFDRAEMLRLVAERHGADVAEMLARMIDVGSSPAGLPTDEPKA
jgi:hypothetical protein